jgi:predicted dehydrogenase
VAHLPALAKVAALRLVAVCDASAPVAEAVAARHGADRACTRPEALLEDGDVDALLISVPDRLHLSLARAALEAGKHVLVEKPLAPSVDECREIVEAADRTGLKVQVGAMKRHDPGIQFAKRFIGDHLGELQSFRAWYRISSTRAAEERILFPEIVGDPLSQRRDPDYKADRARYSLMTHGAHLFDGLRYLLGDPRYLVAQMGSIGRDHSWHGLWSLPGGGLGSFELSVDVRAPASEGYEVFGAGGAVQVDTHFPFYRRASDVRAFDALVGQWSVPALGAADAYQRQLEAFARAILLDETTTPDARDGLAAVRLIECVEESVRSGGSARP